MSRLDSHRPPVESSSEIGPSRVRSAEPKSRVLPTRSRLIRKSAPPLRMFRLPSRLNPAYPSPTPMSRNRSARAVEAVVARASTSAAPIRLQRDRVMSDSLLTATECDETSTLPAATRAMQAGDRTFAASHRRCTSISAWPRARTLENTSPGHDAKGQRALPSAS